MVSHDLLLELSSAKTWAGNMKEYIIIKIYGIRITFIPIQCYIKETQ